MTAPLLPLRSRPKLAGAGLLALAALAASCGKPSDTPSDTSIRNVVLFVCDTLRADRLGSYGYERDTTPNLDAMAAAGTRYARNYSQGPWTVPSMISMFSGLYVFAEEQVLPNTPTLPETLAEGEVYTAGFVGNDVLIGQRGFERGFEEFHRPPMAGRYATRMVDFFEEWWDANEDDLAAADKRFFWIHAFDPHAPFAPEKGALPEDWKARLDLEDYRELWEAARPEADAHKLPDSLEFFPAVKYMNALSVAYDGEVLGVDTAFGALIDFLAERGELEETLIVFASDHGEKFFEHPLYPLEKNLKVEQHGGYPLGVADLFTYSHRAFFQDELWNTPLILQGPGIAAGRVVDELSSNLDLYPTVCAAFGLTPPPGVEGRNLLAPEPPALERVYAYGFETEAVIEPSGLKLVRHMPRRFGLPDDAERPVELLDSAADPRERIDFAAQRPEEVARLLGAIDGWRERVDRPYETEISPAAGEALRALGYLDYEPKEPAPAEPEGARD